MKRFLLVSLLFLCACDAPAPVLRQYEEIIIEPDQVQAIAKSSSSTLSINWEVPPGWKQFLGSGMRMVTLGTVEPSSIDCSLVVLSGASGGVQANIQRWMNQVDIELPDESEMQAYIRDLEAVDDKDGHPFLIIDLTQFQQQQELATSGMIAAIATIDGHSVFVKMTGALKEISDNKKQFYQFIKSLHQN